MEYNVEISNERTYDDAATKLYRVIVKDRSVYATLTTSPVVVTGWIQHIKSTLNFDNPKFRLIAGLDIELVGDAPEARVATIQISVGTECLIFHMLWAHNGLPYRLQQFLLDWAHNIFVGVGVLLKLELLKQETGLEGEVPYIELGPVVASKYKVPELKKAGLDELSRTAISYHMGPRPDNIIRDWEEPSEQDVGYACTGANVSLQIGMKMRYTIMELLVRIN